MPPVAILGFSVPSGLEGYFALDTDHILLLRPHRATSWTSGDLSGEKTTCTKTGHIPQIGKDETPGGLASDIPSLQARLACPHLSCPGTRNIEFSNSASFKSLVL